MVPFGGVQPTGYQIELPLGRADAPSGLLLKGVQNVDGSLETNRVDRSERIAVVARDYL